jgi:ribose transport system permease protein
MPHRLHSLLRFQECGIVAVILILGVLLTRFSGTVRLPLVERGADGESHRVFTTGPDGARTPAFVTRNKFLNGQNLAQLAKDTSFIAIMAVGSSLVIISGGIDLSVGALYALTSVIGALVLRRFGPDGCSAGVPAWEAILLGAGACAGTAAACGAANGLLIVALRVHPFVVTLGSMAILRGIAFVITSGQSVGGFPPALHALVRFQAGDGLTVVPLAAMVLATAAGWIFLSRLAAGRRTYAVGGNEQAARFSGIRVPRVKLLVYTLSGLSAGVAGFLAIGYYGAAGSGDGQGYELSVIAAAVVGGASLSGGKGSALGVVLGALVIQMISSGIILLGIDQNYSQIVLGSVVIAAVVLDNVNTWFARKEFLR